MAIAKAWDLQLNRNPWLSFGVHIDHRDPSITLHLPFVIVAFGRVTQPGFEWSVRNRSRSKSCEMPEGRA